MSAQPKPNEPSMEEILASIRRIISDDDVKPGDAPGDVAPAPVAAEEPTSEAQAAPVDDDVLDLGAEAMLVPQPAPAPEPAQPVPEALDLGDIDFLEPNESAPAPEPAPVAARAPEPVLAAPPAPAFAPAPTAAGLDMAQLLSDQASASVTSAFGQLAHTVLSGNARTLEDLVKDMLKPMLKAWLDDNLPVMVERLVRAEIERVARGGRQ